MGEKFSDTRLLSPKFSEAVSWALELHARHWRKGTNIPYVSHFMAVSEPAVTIGFSANQCPTKDNLLNAAGHILTQTNSKMDPLRSAIQLRRFYRHQRVRKPDGS